MIGRSNSRPKQIIAFQYFTYFGTMGILLPYFNLYCYHLNFSGLQIGLLSSLRSLVLIIFPMAWGALADRFNLRRPLYISCSAICTLLWVPLFLTRQYPSVLVVVLLHSVFYAPLIAFLEAFAMEALEANKGAYGNLRAWGSASFIAVVLLMGKAIDLFSIDLVIALTQTGLLVLALSALLLPRVAPRLKASLWAQARGLLRPRTLVFLGSAFLMLVSHGTYYGFFSIHLEKLGYGNTFIGFSWALASCAEILVMLKSQALFKRFSLQKVLVISFMVAALRWFILSSATSGPVILVSQLLHAITYGTFHMASILYMDLLSPVEAKTTGQAVNNAMTYGLGLMVGFLLNGLLYESIGTFHLFALSGVVALAGGGLLWVAIMTRGQGPSNSAT